MPKAKHSLNEFQQRSVVLGETVSIFEAEAKSLPALRQWLDDAQSMAGTNDMKRWGHLLRCLLNTYHLHDEPNNGTTDAQRLTAYLDAMAGLAPEHWGVPNPDSGGTGPRSTPYETCRHVLKALDSKGFYQGRHLLVQALNSGWNPDAVLNKLTHMAQYHAPQEGILWQHQARGVLLLSLWSTLRETSWRPADTAAYGDMWDICSIDASMADSANAVLLARSVPSQSARMLDALLNSTNIDGGAIQSFFPLRLDFCDPLECIKPLVGLLVEGGLDDLSYKALEVAKQLRMHHPELASLLHMHLTLFPEITESNTLAELVVPGFNALYGRPVEPALTLEGDFFETSPTHSSGAHA